MIDGKDSILPIITFDGTTDWSHLATIAESHLDRRGLNSLIAALSITVKCIAVEREYIDKDYRDTFAHFHSRRFSTPSSRCLRLHFFNREIPRTGFREACLKPDKLRALNQSYLGYSVIRPTKPNC